MIQRIASTVAKKPIWLFATLWIYALLRYALLPALPTPIANWSAFITNKALAASAVCALVLGAFSFASDTTSARRLLGLSLTFGLAHGLASLALLSPGYFPFLYPDEEELFNAFGVQIREFRLNGFGECTVIFGALALALMVRKAIRIDQTSMHRGLWLTWLILSGHIIAVGVLKWMDPTRWPYGFLPISLVSYLVLSAGWFALFKHRSMGDKALTKPHTPQDPK